MNLVVKQYNEVMKEKWDKFVYDNSMGWAYHLYDVIAIDRSVYNKNFSFVIVDSDNNDEILMLVMLHKTGRSLLRLKFNWRCEFLSRWGYVLKDNLSKKQIKAVKQTFEKYIDNLIIKEKVKGFTASLCPLTDFFTKSLTNINPLIYFNFAPSIRYSYLVDLSKSKERMLADCEETTRQAIRKIAKSEKYEIMESSGSEEDCLTYIKLHKETYIRTRAKKSIIDDLYHENMFYTLIPQGICKVFFLIDKENKEKVATVSILVYKNTAYYWWGCSKNDKDVGVNKYLLFSVMNILKEEFNDKGYFETGGAYVHLRRGKWKGLNDFKKCFGVFLAPIFIGTYKR